MTMLPRLAVIAAFAAVLPLAAAAQQPAPKPTKAAAQKVVQIIGADKAKSKTYCDLIALGEEIDAAAQKKDDKKMDELSQKADSMAATLGQEYVTLMAGLEDMDPNSKTGQDIAGVLDGLDKLCDAK